MAMFSVYDESNKLIGNFGIEQHIDSTLLGHADKILLIALQVYLQAVVIGKLQQTAQCIALFAEGYIIAAFSGGNSRLHTCRTTTNNKHGLGVLSLTDILAEAETFFASDKGIYAADKVTMQVITVGTVRQRRQGVISSDLPIRDFSGR